MRDNLDAHPFDGAPCAALLPSLRRRILASLAVLGGGAVLFVLYLGFLGTHFPWYQNLAVGLSLGIVTPLVVVGLWISWGLGSVDRWIHGQGWDDW